MRPLAPLLPALDIEWPWGIGPVLSPRNERAPTPAEAEHLGPLPSY
ncbi:hypothetical protein V4Y04_35800 [Streptomyces sp. P9-A2]